MEDIKKEIDKICILITDEITTAYNKKNFGRVVSNISEVIERSIDADYLKGQYAGYNLLGNMNFNLCNYPEALEYFIRSLSIAEKMKDEKNISFAQNNIGLIFFRLKKIDKALEYYSKALKIKLKINDEPSISTAYNNIGLIYNNKKEYAEALEYFNKAIEIDKKNNNFKAETRELNNIGLSYKHLGKKSKSLECFKRSMDISRKHKYKKGMATALSNLSNHYLNNNDADKAVSNALEGVRIADQLDSNNHILYFYDIISQAYEKKGEYSKALEYFKKYSSLKDTIISEETNERIFEMQIKYESEKNRKETDEYRRKAKELEKTNATKDKFFRIIHHDLLNPFTAIRSTSGFLKNFYHKIDDKKRLSYVDMILNSTDRLVKLMDNLFNWVKAQTGEIDYNPEKTDLKEMAQHNLELYANNIHSKNIVTELKCKGEPFSNSDRNMTGTVIRNLIGNAIKFTYNGGKIFIEITENEESVSLSVQDNGTGIEKDDIPKLFDVSEGFSTPGTDEEKGTGLGLILSKEFADINKGNISVESSPGKGSRFTLELPKYF